MDMYISQVSLHTYISLCRRPRSDDTPEQTHPVHRILFQISFPGETNQDFQKKMADSRTEASNIQYKLGECFSDIN